MTVDLDRIRQAHERIVPYVHCTPVLSSELISAEAGCELCFKCENLQKTGAFKARGAHNAVLALSDERRTRGVATHSSGNHGAALSLAAARTGIPAHIVMPENAPQVKIATVRAYGGTIVFCAPTQAAREKALAELCGCTGAEFIPSYEHPDVIAGQGTVVLELEAQLEQAPDYLITPVGGGGLLGGSSVASRALWPNTRVLGAEPAGADDAMRSFRRGEHVPQLAPDTIADGLRTSLGVLNFELILANVEDILTVDDAAIVEAMRLVWTRMKMIIEPSAAVALAAVLANRETFAGKRVAVVFSGGNVDLDRLPWMREPVGTASRG